MHDKYDHITSNIIWSTYSEHWKLAVLTQFTILRLKHANSKQHYQRALPKISKVFKMTINTNNFQFQQNYHSIRQPGKSQNNKLKLKFNYSKLPYLLRIGSVYACNTSCKSEPKKTFFMFYSDSVCITIIYN